MRCVAQRVRGAFYMSKHTRVQNNLDLFTLYINVSFSDSIAFQNLSLYITILRRIPIPPSSHFPTTRSISPLKLNVPEQLLYRRSLSPHSSVCIDSYKSAHGTHLFMACPRSARVYASYIYLVLYSERR